MEKKFNQSNENYNITTTDAPNLINLIKDQWYSEDLNRLDRLLRLSADLNSEITDHNYFKKIVIYQSEVSLFENIQTDLFRTESDYKIIVDLNKYCLNFYLDNVLVWIDECQNFENIRELITNCTESTLLTEMNEMKKIYFNDYWNKRVQKIDNHFLKPLDTYNIQLYETNDSDDFLDLVTLDEGLYYGEYVHPSMGREYMLWIIEPMSTDVIDFEIEQNNLIYDGLTLGEIKFISKKGNINALSKHAFVKNDHLKEKLLDLMQYSPHDFLKYFIKLELSISDSQIHDDFTEILFSSMIREKISLINPDLINRIDQLIERKQVRS